MPQTVVPFPGSKDTPATSPTQPRHELLNDVAVEALRSLKEVLRTPIFGSADVMKRRIDAASLVLATAASMDPTCFAPPAKGSRARAKRLAALQAQIDELKLEAQRVQAEASVAALKKRPRP